MVSQTKKTKVIKKSTAKAKKISSGKEKLVKPKAVAKKKTVLFNKAQAADDLHQRTKLSEVVIDFNLPVFSTEPEGQNQNKGLIWDLEDFITKEGENIPVIEAITQQEVVQEKKPDLPLKTDRKIILDKSGNILGINIQSNLHQSGHILDLRPVEKIPQPTEPASGEPTPITASSFLSWPQKSSFRFFKFKSPQLVVSKTEKDDGKNSNPWPRLSSLERLRIVLTFVIFAFLFVMPVKGFVFYKQVNLIKDHLINFSQAAAIDLQSGVQAATTADWQGALTKFQSAELSLAQAADYLQNTQANLQQVLFGINPLASASHLITGATQLTQLAEKFTASIALWNNQEQSINQQLPWVEKQLNELLPEALAANASLQQASVFGLPQKYKDQIQQLQAFLPYFITQLGQIKDLTASLSEALGYNQEKRYLIVFQNNNELRATGGFLGSFAQVDVDKGEIKNMDIPGGGFYDLQGPATNYTLNPEPMRLVGRTARWMAQDANWYPDFPTTAQKIQWFYEKAGGPTTDGVLAINASLLPKLLAFVGPVTLPKFGLTLTDKNVIQELQKQVEFNYDKEENKPKQIIAEAAPIILGRLQNLNKEKYPELLQVLMAALKQKEVQIYFNSPDLEKKADDWQWTGRVLATKSDYTLAITQNIGGGKSDAYSTQNLEQFINFNEDGSILKTIAVTRSQQPARPDDVFSFSQNNSFIRIYAPETAEFLSTHGQILPPADALKKSTVYLSPDPDLVRVSGKIISDPITQTTINKEFGKQVFGNWLSTAPSDNKTLSFAYHVPAGLINWEENRLSDWLSKLGFHKTQHGTYQLLIQKQSGLNNQRVVTNFSWPENYQVEVGKLPAKATVESQPGKMTITYLQNQDEIITLNITKK